MVPTVCTAEQERKTVTMLFKQTSSFRFNLTVVGRQIGKRPNFFFGGRSCITEHCSAYQDEALLASPRQSDTHDCKAGFSTWRLDWSHAKKAWCCTTEHVGCPYDCHTKGEWSMVKRAFCCHEFHLGCTTPQPRITTTLTQEWYNCEDGFAEWKQLWSYEKRGWCCQVYARGCTAQTANPSTSTSLGEPYDCSAGYSNFHAAWSARKQNWCCRMYNRACAVSDSAGEPHKLPRSETNECQDGYSHPRVRLQWNATQKEWCCTRYAIGCPAESAATDLVREYAGLLSKNRSVGGIDIVRFDSLLLAICCSAAVSFFCVLGIVCCCVRAGCSSNPSLRSVATRHGVAAWDVSRQGVAHTNCVALYAATETDSGNSDAEQASVSYI